MYKAAAAPLQPVELLLDSVTAMAFCKLLTVLILIHNTGGKKD